MSSAALRNTRGALLLMLFASAASAGPLEDLQPGHWYEAPNSRMSTVDPCPNRNCSYSGNGGQRAVISDWNGGAFATRYGTKGAMLAWGGGHAGYLGNEIYAFDLATLSWNRVTEPVNNPNCSHGEAELQNGTPCSPHNYDYIDYHPGTNSFVKLGSASDHMEGGGGSPRVHLFSFDTDTWRRGARKQNWTTGTGSTSAYDPNRDVFWYLPAYNEPFGKYDPNANGGAGQWTEYQRFWIEIDGNAAIDPDHDLYVVLDGRGTQGVYAFDLKNPNQPPVEVRVSGDDTAARSKANGFDWDSASKQFVAWVSGTQVYTLKPPAGDWRTATWTWTRVNAAPTNTVTPSAPQSVGTYSRWRYVPNLNIFVLLNSNTSNVFFYKLSTGGGVTNPAITFSADPTSIPAQGTTELTWSVTDADACTASATPAIPGWSGSKAMSGTQTLGAIAASTAFRLSCTNTDGGSANRTVNVTVAAFDPAPTVNLSANPATVPSGGSTTLQWTTSNATSCTGSGGIAGWPGSKPTTGSQNVGPFSGNVTFTLSCTGAGGTTQDSATVSVVSAPTVNFTANPMTVATGARSTLTWSSTNASTCAASGGWSGNKATSGNQQSPVLSSTTNFVLDCTGPGGTTSRNVTVTVNGTPPPAAPTVNLSASPATVSVNGNSTLSWTTTNATACTASGGWTGSKPTSGSETTSALSDTQTFTLTCSGAGGSASDSATVTVSAGGGGGGGGGGDTGSSGGGGSMGWFSIAGMAMLLLTRRRRGVAV